MSRVQALLNRIVEYSGDPNTIKTCCGVLSILSRSEDKKTEIANAGLLVILQAMNTHMSNEELLESACDLLWTLAFNNKPVKASISAHGGIATLLRCVDVHRLNAALLRSALGTLSNLSQLPDNQQHIGLGLPVIVAATQLHAGNVDLLAFALDTLTSIIIGHEKNCRIVFELGVVDFLLDVLQDSGRAGVVKSACHTLAILCELPGVGKGIADARGVKIIIQAMATAPLPTDVERIITVLLFRISKDPAVIPQMIEDGVVLVLFKVLSNQRAALKCSETLLATCHILSLMTQFAATHAVDLTPFAPQVACHGDLLLRLATDNGAPLALSIFRILAHMARNPVPLPALVNVSTMESMLALSAFHSNPPEMLQLAIEVVTGLRRSLVQAQRLRTPEKTLAALLACIRSYPDDMALMDQVFCIVTVYSLSDEAPAHPRTVFGFIGAAMRFLSRFSSADWAPSAMIEACRFLLHVMGSKEGLESMISCGGVNVLKQFNDDVFKAVAGVPPELQKLLHGMCLRLETPFLMPMQLPVVLANQEGDDHVPPPVVATDVEEPDDELDDDDEEEEEVAVQQDDEDDDCVDDLSDCCDDVNDPQVDDVDDTAPHTATATDPKDKEMAPTVSGSLMTAQSLLAYLRDNDAVDIVPSQRTPSTVQDGRYNYVNPTSGNKLPKHPLKRLVNQQPSDHHHVLLTTCPIQPEPASCTFADTWAMQSYIDERTQARVDFLRTDGPAKAQLVYQSSHAAGDVSVTSHVAEAVYPYAVPLPQQGNPHHHLTFDSEFDGGNLLRAVQIGPFEYDLVLRPDLHTQGYTQWFYFAVSNVDVAVDYRFNIVNLYKPDSLFNTGLQPVVYSLEQAETQAMGWTRAGRQVCYYANPWRQPPKKEDFHPTYFTMSFTLAFPSADDTFLIAHSYPYTLLDHRWHMRQPQFLVPQVVRRTVLCRTLGQHDCDLLTITDFAYEMDAIDARPVVVLTARVHPGEPQASWVMRGALDFLVSDAHDARLLRRLFVFKVVPILNPDGVLYGNNRCGLAACDLNRQWKTPRPQSHPTIHAIKSLMQSLPVVFYCDIHGHSRKKNVFMYGCDTRKYINPIARAFPRLLSTHWIGQQYVSLDSCNFQVNRGREATARVVVGRDMGILNSFTLEASFCGADFGVLAHQHFNLRHLQDVGLALAQTLMEYAMPEAMDRVVVYEWLQQHDQAHDILGYIEAQYRERRQELSLSVIPMHMTLVPLLERKPSNGRLAKKASTKPKLKKKKSTKASQQQLQTTPTPPTSVAKGPKLHSIKTSPQPPPLTTTLVKKPPTKPPKKNEPKKSSKLQTSASTPPPLALKKALSLPSPKNQLQTRYKPLETNAAEVLKYKSPNLSPGFRRLTLFQPPSFRELPREAADERAPRRISFPTVSK
ncbi:Aste57867_13120 [Aphanomyces stellatus]|uniref:tubulin-glutamate carboxypeptidase n=1 Tax=Aphanomyces stellatus TaxID=120398 RepID=A0A485KXS2_9STRA|nr:hypothetical protein As57867_013071 [Aphanomyces stellatus]VFT89962.1 Aste57867_13120 [Aphanomyces stellatus]